LSYWAKYFNKTVTYLLCFGTITFGHIANSRAEELVIGVEDIAYYPYFDFTSEKMTFSKTVLNKFAEDNGLQIRYLPLPIKRFSKWLFDDDIDFKFPDNRRWQDQRNTKKVEIYFSENVVYMTAGTVILDKHKDKKEDFFKSIGTITGFHPILWLNQIEQGKVRIIEDTSPKVLVNQLTHNIVDGLDIDLAVANHHLRELALSDKLTISPNTQKQVFSYQLSTTKHPAVIKQFNQWLIANKGFVSEVKKSYGILQVEPQLN
jgi:hypothetical protein